MRRREGRYLLRTNLTDYDPDIFWRYYMQLVFVEEAFRTLKGVLAIRPVYHQKPSRIEARLFVAFLAHCLSITLRQQLRGLAGGVMPRVVLEKFAAAKMLDVRVPTTDGRELWLARRTEPARDVVLLLQQLGLTFPAQPPPRSAPPRLPQRRCRPDLSAITTMNKQLTFLNRSGWRSRVNIGQTIYGTEWATKKLRRSPPG